MNSRMVLSLFLLFAAAPAMGDALPSDEEFRAMINDGEAEAMVEQLEARLEDGPPSADIHYWMGRGELAQIDSASMFKKLGLARSAKANFEDAIALDPEHIGARESLARYYAEAPAVAGGSKDAAREQAQALVEISPAAAYRVESVIARSEDDPDAATQWLSKALAADEWRWDVQYDLMVYAVHNQVSSAAAVLHTAAGNVEAESDQPEKLLPLVDYQRGKLSAVTGDDLDLGQAALLRYLESAPGPDEPSLDWAAFRLAQVERQLGRLAAAEVRLAMLEDNDPTEDLTIALRDERRWHYD